MKSTFRHDVENLLSAWAIGFDERDLSMMADCLMSDAELSIRIAGGDTTSRYSGRKKILELVQESWRQQHDRRRHVLSNIIVGGEVDAATSTSYLTIVSIRDGVARIATAGQYHDELVLDSGGWKFAKRLLLLDLPY